MNFRKLALFATVFALAFCVSSWAQLTQPPCNGFPNVALCHTFDFTGNAEASQNDTNGLGNFATVYDNFNFFTAIPITGYHWVGEYFNPPTQGVQSLVGPSTSTTTMGSRLLWPTKIIAAPGCGPNQVCETFLGSFMGFPTYRYDISNQPAFTTNNLLSYALAVIPDLGFPPQWGWSTADSSHGPCDECDKIAWQDFFGVRSLLNVDMAFALERQGAQTCPLAHCRF
jgi:hypothetical protein